MLLGMMFPGAPADLGKQLVAAPACSIFSHNVVANHLSAVA